MWISRVKQVLRVTVRCFGLGARLLPDDDDNLATRNLRLRTCRGLGIKIEVGIGKVLDPVFLVLDETAQKVTKWFPFLTCAHSLRWQALVLSNTIGMIASADFVFLT